MRDRLKEKVAALPQSPGVYLFKDAQGKIIYIGKAKALKKRVQSYFSRALDSKTQAMVSKIAGLQYHIAPSESQAQIVEAALIKEYQPHYNIDLKDDKSFPFIRITNEPFPIVSIHRRKGKAPSDLAFYFGPYTNVKLLRQALKLIRRVFGFRSCSHMPQKPCLYYRLKVCPAPCSGKLYAAQYQEVIAQIKLFLESRYEELLRRLAEQMKERAAAQEFEAAAALRDQINALGAIGQRQPFAAGIDELRQLKRALRLARLPLRIEGFDISNISGREACGAMVSFYKGAPDKKNYRRFRIKTVEGIDDYKMLREVVRRRYQRLIQEKLPLPDLILIDGGKAHLSAAQEEIKNLRLSIPLASIAKERENIYICNRRKPITLYRQTLALNLIRRLRDEAHRFAVAYHHLLRRKKTIGR